MMSFLQAFGLSAISFVVVLSVLVTIHELGHFLTAKAFGVAIDRFSVGFGRAILSRTDRSGVEWRIGWIPLGGYVRFAGDENDASVPDQNDLEEMRRRIRAAEGPGAEMKYLAFKPVWQRALIAAAGPAANFVLAIAIFTFIFAAFGEPVMPSVVHSVTPGSAAARAGFMAGDHVISADRTPIRNQGELSDYVVVRDGRAIDFGLIRGGRMMHITATPVRTRLSTGLNVEQYGGQLGLSFMGAHWQHYTLPEAFSRGVARTWSVVSTTAFYLSRIVTGQASGDQIGGPLQMASISGAVAQASLHEDIPLGDRLLGGALGLLSLAGFISVGLGFMNLLPIPVLDGGHLLFYAYEAVARRPLAARLQAVGYRLGLALLLCLMLFATWNDLQRLRVFQSFGGLFS